MYFIFTPNKVFVQFQINDYLGDSADLHVIFTPKASCSLRKLLNPQKKQEKKLINSKRRLAKLKMVKLDEFFPNELVRNKDGQSVEPNQGAFINPLAKSRFNLIQNDEWDRNPTSLLDPEVPNTQLLKLQQLSVSSSYAGKYIPFKWVLEEYSEIFSRYAAGVIHKIYLQDFRIPEELKQLDIENGPGFPAMTYFYILYFLPFLHLKSIANFARINSLEFAVLINRAGKPVPDAVRKFWNRALSRVQADQFAKDLYYKINQLDPRLGYGVFVDEHFVVYQGRQKMAKGKGGGGTQFLKGFYRYSFLCALFSIPLYTTPKEGRTRLEPILLDLIAEYEAVSRKKVRLIIFDRGIKSFKTLKQLVEAGYHFICWSFPYSTVEKALQRRRKLKFVRISEMYANLLEVRQKKLLQTDNTPETQALRQFLEACLPEAQLQAKLRTIQQKEAGKKDWNDRDFLWVYDTQVTFEEFGALRTIIVERANGKRLAVFTSFPSDQVHSIEALEMLKRRQHIENYYKDKIRILGDYIPSWRLLASDLQQTNLKARIQEPDWHQLESYQKKQKRILHKLKTLEAEYKMVKTLYKTGKISKRHFNQREKTLKRNYRQKELELQEVKAFIEWGKSGTRPTYFDQFEAIMELDSPLETLLNVINDLYFVNSRRIAMDWANALLFAKREGVLDIPTSIIKRVANLTPYSLNDILVKGGGKVIKSPVPDQPVIIELHTEFFYKDYNLIVYFIRFFKDFCNGLKRDMNFDFPF